MAEKINIYMVDGNVVSVPGSLDTLAQIADLIENSNGVLAYKTGDGRGGFIFPKHVIRVELVDEPQKPTATEVLSNMKAINEAFRSRENK